MNFRDWNWDKLDEIVASFARPYQQYLCATAVAAALIIVVLKTDDALAIAAIATPCAGLAGWSATLRSTDKKTAATIEIAKNRPAPDTTVEAKL